LFLAEILSLDCAEHFVAAGELNQENKDLSGRFIKRAVVLSILTGKDMMQFFDEILLVLPRSLKAQVAIVLGPLSFVAVALLWGYLSKSFYGHGIFDDLMVAQKERFSRRYLWFGTVTWTSFWVITVRTYLRDRKRVLGL
jgi:hypothetical protein